MKKLLAILVFAIAPLAYAQNIVISKMSIELQCFALSDFDRVLNMYDETGVFSMDTITVNRSGQRIETQTVFTLNPKNREWSMYRQVDDETVCVHAAGFNFNFMPPAEKPKI